MRGIRLAGGVAMMLMTAGAWAQTPIEKSTEAKPTEAAAPDLYENFYMASPGQQSEANDIVTDMRNMLPRARIYLVASQNALSIRGSAEDLALARRILADIDRGRATYRLSYTITETENGKKTGTQHFEVIVAAGGKAQLKQGSRVPLLVGKVDAGGSAEKSEVQYVDVGLSIEATIDGSRLRTKVEQSTIADEKSAVGAQDPVIRQGVLEETSTLVEGKPLVLGSFDIPGTARHEEIGVVSELQR